VGLAAVLTAPFYSAASIIMPDLDHNRLAITTRVGATAGMNSSDGNVPKANVRSG
jgi:Zn-dependent alcohol dehydrogenase